MMSRIVTAVSAGGSGQSSYSGGWAPGRSAQRQALNEGAKTVETAVEKSTEVTTKVAKSVIENANLAQQVLDAQYQNIMMARKFLGL